MELTERRPTNDWRRWHTTRRGTFTIAVICALVAGVILVVALNGYRHSVNTSGKPATVLVATKLIEQGTSGDAIGVEEMFKPVKVAQKNVSSGAFIEAGSRHGKVAAADIYPGQQLTSAEFTTGGDLVSRLAATQRAVAVPVDTSHGMIGDIQSGDHVDVYASFTKGGAAELRLLAPNVEVLRAAKVAHGGLGSNNQTTATANVVLEVNDRQAAMLAFTADNGKIWLTLRPGNGAAPAKEIVSEASILGG